MKNPMKVSRGGLYLITSLLLAANTTPTIAQSRLNENVAVDGRYLPEVTRAERLRSSLTPLVMTFGSEPTEAAYGGEPVDFMPSLLPMPATVWRSDPISGREKGYIDASLGSWLTGRLLAGYRPIVSDRLTLGLRFDGNSTALYRPEDCLYRRRRFEGTLGIDLRSDFNNGGRLSASAQYHLGWFNYDLLRSRNSDKLNPNQTSDPASPTQTINDASLSVGWDSDRKSDVRWNAGAAFRYFGYRSLPFSTVTPTRETSLMIKGGVDGDVSIGRLASNWGIDGSATLHSYGGDLHPGTNGLLSLTPDWNISRPLGTNREGIRWEARIGMKLDFSFNHSADFGDIYPLYPGRSEGAAEGAIYERFPFLHIAPDCSVSCATDLFGAWFRAGGGVEEQTLGALNDLDLYAAPFLTGSLPAYTPADLRLGFSLTPASGLALSLEGRWKTTQSIYSGGLWVETLQTMAQLSPTSETLPLASTYFSLHGFSVRFEAEWKAWKWLEAQTEVTWQPQHRSTGWFNGYDRPEWTAGVNLASNPWRTLRIEAGWELRAKRSATIAGTTGWAASLPLNNLSDLSVGLSYAFSPNFTIGARLNNLLDRKTSLLPGFVSEGFSATGGLQFLF